MFKEIVLGLIVILAVSYMIMFHTFIFFSLVALAAILVLAFAIGDLLLMEYHNRK